MVTRWIDKLLHRRSRLNLNLTQWLETLLQDARYGLRGLRKNPGFTSVAVLSLALGIGANTAIFSLIDALLLKPLPVHDPARLVFLGTLGTQGTGFNFYYESYERMKREQAFLAGMAAFAPVRLNVSVDGDLEPLVHGSLVSGGYFGLLGVAPVLGRAIGEEDDRMPGAHPVAMISYAYWQRRFGLARDVLGRKILIDGTPFDIVGVLPSGFFGLEPGSAPDITVPLMMQPAVMPDVENWLVRPRNTTDWLRIVARLRPETSLGQAEAGMRVLFRRVQIQLASELEKNWQLSWAKAWAEAPLVLEPGGSGISDLRRFARPLLVLLGIAGVVLLIACANLASLLLARASSRSREIAVRLAIGAGRVRLARQLLVESLLLAGLGGAAGLFMALWASQLLVRFLAVGQAPIVLDLRADFRVLTFMGLVSLCTGILFGLAPAWRASRVDVGLALKDGARAAGGRVWIGRGLVAGQMALSLVLVVAAGLFAGSLRKLNAADSGFARDHVLTVRIEPRGSDQKGRHLAQLNRLYLDLQERVSAIPGVRVASMAGASPTAELQQRPLRTTDGREVRARWTQVYPRYFASLGTGFLAGRDFSAEDFRSGAPVVAIVNETFSRRAFDGENPIGKRIKCSREDFCEVIGVVRDLRYANLKGEPEPAVYQTFPQARTGRGQMVLHVRCAGDPEMVAAAVRPIVAALDRQLPAFDVRSLEGEVDAVLVRERMLALLSALFGGLAVVLAAVGLYGVMAYAVGRRTKEIGIRMALGASRAEVQWLILGEALRVVAAGLLVGLPVAMAAIKVLGSFLYGVDSQPLIFAGAVLVLTAIAVVAGWGPARRAARVDPMVALRWE